MPIFYTYCSKCLKQKTFLLKKKEELLTKQCDGCGVLLGKERNSPTTQTRETIDDGIMIRSVEILRDVKQMLQERSKQHDEQFNPLTFI